MDLYSLLSCLSCSTGTEFKYRNVRVFVVVCVLFNFYSERRFFFILAAFYKNLLCKSLMNTNCKCYRPTCWTAGKLRCRCFSLCVKN